MGFWRYVASASYIIEVCCALALDHSFVIIRQTDQLMVQNMAALRLLK